MINLRGRTGFTRRSSIVCATALGVTYVLAVGVPAAAADAQPGAPTNLTAVRSAKVNDFVVSWTASTGSVSRYTVLLFADGKFTQRVVPAKTTSLKVKGSGLMSIYQVRVSAGNDKNLGGSSAEITVPPALPGAPVDVFGEPAAAGGMLLAWSPPARQGYSPVLRYRVDLIDTVSRVTSTYQTSGAATTLHLPSVDASRQYELKVSAVTANGIGIPQRADVGGVVPSAPQWFTAVRDPNSVEHVVLSWSRPNWSGGTGILGYEINTGSESAPAWQAVAMTGSTRLPLAAAKGGLFSVRATSLNGSSAATGQVVVDPLAKTLSASAAYPVTVVTKGRTVTVGFYAGLADSKHKFLVRLLPQEGWDYADERTVDNGTLMSVTLADVPSGRYNLMVSGTDRKLRNETKLYSQEVIVNGDSTSSSEVSASFAEGTGKWRAVWPAGRLPKVVMSKTLAFDGTTSMAITATSNSVAGNVSVDGGVANGIATVPGQQLIVSAHGLPTTAATRWNMGISWWNASGKQIAVMRVKRVKPAVGVWAESAGTFTAPVGATTASAFVEVGELLSGQTFYVDGVALRTHTHAPKLQGS